MELIMWVLTILWAVNTWLLVLCAVELRIIRDHVEPKEECGYCGEMVKDTIALFGKRSCPDCGEAMFSYAPKDFLRGEGPSASPRSRPGSGGPPGPKPSAGSRP